jgi:hypothetical protein
MWPFTARTSKHQEKTTSTARPTSPSTSQSQPNASFPPFTGSGVCDVCNASLDERKAYVVPNRIFYHSAKYREQQRNSTIAKLTGIPMTDDYFAQALARDKSPGSAVCEECIHLFP